MKIFIVTYYDKGELTVTAFSNYEAAMACYRHFKETHAIVSIDKCEVYNEFLVYDQQNERSDDI